jgi:hypothetical protein
MKRSPKRMFLVLGSVVVATACGGGGGGGTAPTPARPSSIQQWAGSVKFSSTVSANGGNTTEAWTGTVSWILDPDPETAPLGSDVVYKIQSGSLEVTTSITADGCSSHGVTKIKLEPNDGFLVLTPSGFYSGYLKQTHEFQVKVECPGGSIDIPWGLGSHGWLAIRGQMADLRMHADMTPVVTPNISSTGSWDFGGIEVVP